MIFHLLNHAVLFEDFVVDNGAIKFNLTRGILLVPFELITNAKNLYMYSTSREIVTYRNPIAPLVC